MNDFLKQTESQLAQNKNKISVMNELYDHVMTNTEFYEEIGYEKLTGYEKSNEAMGDGVIIGQRLNAVNKDFGMKQRILFAFCIFVNLFLPPFVARPVGDNTFTAPFLFAVVIYIVNSVFTIFAIKQKSQITSILLFAISFTTFLLYEKKLTYPICNLIMLENVQMRKVLYDAVSLILVIIICLSLALPNIYNIYYCNMVKKLKNTRKQYYFTKKIIASLVVFSIITAVSAYPLFLINQSYSKKQQAIRDELVTFVYDVSTRFDQPQITELEQYLKDCEYEFLDKLFVNSDNFSSRVCYVDNWIITISVVSDGKLYSLGFQPVAYNSAQPYLFDNDYDKMLEVREQIGDDESDDKNGGCIGMSRDELHSIMSDINYCYFKYYFYGSQYDSNVNDDTEKSGYSYYYKWIMSDSLYAVFGHDSYAFFYDENGECISYDLTLD